MPEWAKAPILWVHTPKTGTSFMNTLIHHPGLCPNTPEDLWYGPPRFNSDHEFFHEYKRDDLCPGAFVKEYPCPPCSVGVADLWEQNHDHAMAFFREPEARLRSGFLHRWHDWPAFLTRKSENGGHSIRRYAEVMQGCQVRMLTWTNHSNWGTHKQKACGGNGTEPTDFEVQLAIDRMRQMKFVGITEEWDFSVCLFHAMYGGECHEHEFMNTRPQATDESHYKWRNHTYSPDELDLKGFQDPYDGALYKAAKERFHSLMAEYNVDRAMCEKTCTPANGNSQPFALKASLREVGASSNPDAYKYDWPGRPIYHVDEDNVDEDG